MIIRWLILSSLYFEYTLSAPNNCCNDVKNVLNSGRCSNANNITGITCIKRYLVDPNAADNFTVNDDDNLLLLAEDLTVVSSVPKDEYCIGKLAEGGIDVALVCFPGDQESDVLFYARAICGLVSVLSLMTTVIVYFLVPALRCLQGKCILHSILGLTIGFVMLSTIQTFRLPGTFCEIAGFTTYFGFFVAFFWLNIISFHIWKTVVKPTMMGTPKQWYMIYCAYGYGAPIIFLIALFVAHVVPGDHIKPGFGMKSCWFPDRKATWYYFYGPIAILLVINVILYTWTAKTLWSDAKEVNQSNCPKIKKQRYRCLLYMKLFFIMGLTWIFEVLSFAFGNVADFMDYIWSVADYINALQGVLILTILVILRKKALRGLAKRGLICITFPETWQTLQDDEGDDDAAEESEEKLSYNNSAAVI